MPFGINLPGPFTWHASDKHAKAIRKGQRHDQLSGALDDMAERAKAKEFERFQAAVMGLYEDDDTRLAVARKLRDLEETMPLMADGYRAEVIAEWDALEAERKAEEKAQKAAHWAEVKEFQNEWKSVELRLVLATKAGDDEAREALVQLYVDAFEHFGGYWKALGETKVSPRGFSSARSNAIKEAKRRYKSKV